MYITANFTLSLNSHNYTSDVFKTSIFFWENVLMIQISPIKIFFCQYLLSNNSNKFGPKDFQLYLIYKNIFFALYVTKDIGCRLVRVGARALRDLYGYSAVIGAGGRRWLQQRRSDVHRGAVSATTTVSASSSLHHACTNNKKY